MPSADGFVIYSNIDNKRRDPGEPALLAMAVFGATLLLGLGLMEQPDWKWLIPAAVVSILIVPIPSRRFQQGLTAFILLLTVLLVTVGRGIFRCGFLQVVNYAIARFNYQYGRDVYYFELPHGIEERSALVIFASIMIFLLACLFHWLLEKRWILPFSLIQVIAIAGVLFLHAAPAYAACCIAGFSIPGAVIWNRAGEDGRKMLAIFLAGFLAIGLGGSLAYMKWGGYSTSDAADSMRQSITGQVEAFRYGKQDVPRGDLGKAAVYRGSGRTRLLIGTERSGNYYLKGYVGGTYRNGRWEEIDPSNYSGKQAGLFSWMKIMDFSPLAQNYEYLQLLEESGQELIGQPSEVVIENKKANRKFLYIPYGISGDDIRNMEGIHRDMDIRQTDKEQKIMSYRTILYDTSEAFAVGNPAWMNTRRAQPGVEDFRQAQVEYRTFVYDHYLDIDPEMKELLMQQLSLADGRGYQEATETICKWLKKDAPAVSLPKGMRNDPLYRFMFMQRQGNSCYYASAGVMMFRHFGIPARYTEGYFASLGEQSYHASLNGDSRLLLRSGEKPAYEKRVSSRHMHAWVEIYKDGIGWVPIEVTPDFVEEIKEQKQQEISEQASGRKENNQPGPQEEEELDLLQIMKRIAMGILAAVAAAVILLLVRRYRIVKQRTNAMAGDDLKRGLGALLPWLREILLYRGEDEEVLPEQLTKALQRYRYRDGKVSQLWYDELSEYAREKCEETYESCSLLRKLHMKYIKALK